jgi:hypothetical protein
MSDTKQMKFYLIDKGIDEKLAGKAANLLMRETIEGIFDKPQDAVRDDYIRADSEVAKLKADMEANASYKECVDVIAMFRRSFNDAANPYKVANKLRMERLEIDSQTV